MTIELHAGHRFRMVPSVSSHKNTNSTAAVMDGYWWHVSIHWLWFSVWVGK
jgi:hypothetical protein